METIVKEYKFLTRYKCWDNDDGHNDGELRRRRRTMLQIKAEPVSPQAKYKYGTFVLIHYRNRRWYLLRPQEGFVRFEVGENIFTYDEMIHFLHGGILFSKARIYNVYENGKEVDFEASPTDVHLGVVEYRYYNIRKCYYDPNTHWRMFAKSVGFAVWNFSLQKRVKINQEP